MLEQPDLQLHSAARKWIRVVVAFVSYFTFFIEAQTFCLMTTHTLKRQHATFPSWCPELHNLLHDKELARLNSWKCIHAFSAMLSRFKGTAGLKDIFLPTFLGWIMERDANTCKNPRMLFASRLGRPVLSLF